MDINMSLIRHYLQNDFDIFQLHYLHGVWRWEASIGDRGCDDGFNERHCGKTAESPNGAIKNLLMSIIETEAYDEDRKRFPLEPSKWGKLLN